MTALNETDRPTPAPKAKPSGASKPKPQDAAVPAEPLPDVGLPPELVKIEAKLHERYGEVFRRLAQ